MQVVPALSPPLGGVGDYALRVAERLEESFGIETTFLACDAGWRGVRREGVFPVRTLRERSANVLSYELQDIFSGGLRGPSGTQVVLLQLSPYGYERNGCPFWLVRGLRSWVDRDPARRKLVTMFHELYATGAPWTKAFWLSSLQKRAVRGILARTSGAMTNMRRYAQELEEWGGTPYRRVHCLPVPSNVGEPEEVLPIGRRVRRVCVFGTSPGLRPLAKHEALLLRQAVRSWEIEEIAMIGGTPNPRTFDDVGCSVVSHRNLAPEQVSSILKESVLGLLWYPAKALGKSTIYAAYCAHGVPAVLLSVQGKNGSSLDGPGVGNHYLTAAALGAPWDAAMLQKVSHSARAWYPAHNISAHASMVAGCVGAVSR